MKTQFQNLVRLVLLAGLSLPSITAYSISLDDVSFASLPGERAQIKLMLSEALPAEPLNFTIDNPARIAIDFPGTTLNLSEKSQTIGIGMANSINAVEAAGRTRVVINLTRAVSYTMDVEGNAVVLTLGSDVESSSSVASTGGTSYVSSSGGLDNIDFRRGENGEGRIIVSLSDPSIPIDMGFEGGKVVIDFIDTQLPSNLDRKLDVIDFATPVKEIDTTSSGNNVRMTISTVNEDYDHLAYQSENQYTIEFKPLSKEELEEQKKDKFGFTGERLSLNFQNIEVRAVLQLIADFTGLNMVVSDSVGGNVTLRLKNVPWDQALDIILKSRGLAMRQSGNVIMVAPSEEIAARERLELEANRQVEELAPLRTEFIQINYANATDLMALIQAEENNLLSERGNVSIDDRTNTLIIQDVGASLEAVRELISELDVPVRQVLIESRIVNADESFAKDIGVRFGYSKHTKQGTQDRATIGQNPQGDPFVSLGGGQTGNTDFGGTTSFNDGTNENLIVDLPAVPADASSLALAIGKVGSYLLQLELSALIAEGRGEDIASPRVITANQNEAIIESGVQIPYQEASSSGATSVSFQDAVLSLRVTPQITPDDRIIMDLQVNQDTVSGTTVLGVPAINTRSVTTQVLVQNGETVVLGGVYTSSDRKSIDRTPFFGDLPYVGFLFKRTDIDSTKSELLIFITPKILKDSLAI
ncbi:MAG: type IV pilus secretin PilQ [Proteobacteria bacterium]|nr:type IV pilus secretin PilQ [Pseudomonadota bacterium]